MGTGAVSRYRLSWSQKFITVQDFNCVQMRVSVLAVVIFNLIIIIS
jgi:hypothetical protein